MEGLDTRSDRTSTLAIRYFPPRVRAPVTGGRAATVSLKRSALIHLKATYTSRRGRAARDAQNYLRGVGVPQQFPVERPVTEEKRLSLPNLALG